jgi:hypothetical protein
MFLKLEPFMNGEERIVRKVAHPLSFKIPALLIRIVTVPNASTAVLMTAAPSETEEVFTTAFPPARNQDLEMP